jgi:hypothetical protein
MLGEESSLSISENTFPKFLENCLHRQLPVKFARILLANPNPITSAEIDYKDSTFVCSHSVQVPVSKERPVPGTVVIHACNIRKVEEYESTFKEMSGEWDVLKKKNHLKGKRNRNMADNSTDIRQAMNCEILFFYVTPYHHWACPSNVTVVATTFLSTTL